MTIEVKVPVLPESVADATVAHWYKKPGDAIARDENLVDLETDKVMLEVPAPEDGVLEKIVQAEGATVKANELLAVIKPGAAPKKEEASESKSDTVSESKAEVSKQPAAEETESASTSTASAAPASSAPASTLSPSARRKAAMGLAVPAAAAMSGAREEKRVPMSRLRAKVAERLVEVTQTTAMLTTFNEVNMKSVMDLRSRYKEQFEKTRDVRLGFMSFFVKAAVEALKRFPAVNASIDGNDIVYHGFFDIGIAVSTERGLVVPVLRNVDQMSMADVERGIREYAAKARDNKITLDDMTGGTFTITNGGVFGSMLSTPIINPPQSAILGMHNIVERAVVENGEVAVRPMMYLAMSYDHRIIDGKESVTFLKTIKELLEDPARINLGV